MVRNLDSNLDPEHYLLTLSLALALNPTTTPTPRPRPKSNPSPNPNPNVAGRLSSVPLQILAIIYDPRWQFWLANAQRGKTYENSSLTSII